MAVGTIGTRARRAKCAMPGLERQGVALVVGEAPLPGDDEAGVRAQDRERVAGHVAHVRAMWLDGHAPARPCDGSVTNPPAHVLLARAEDEEAALRSGQVAA